MVPNVCSIAILVLRRSTDAQAAGMLRRASGTQLFGADAVVAGGRLRLRNFRCTGRRRTHGARLWYFSPREPSSWRLIKSEHVKQIAGDLAPVFCLDIVARHDEHFS